MAGTRRDLFVGVDSGTQSTKVLLVDGDTGKIVASGSAPHRFVDGLPPGHLEQHPEDWFIALETVLGEVLDSPEVHAGDVRAIGVSGQQHGLVALDAAGEVIRPAKLWCDTSTVTQCDEILDKIGGLSRMIELTGNGVPPGFTASKIAWLKEHEPANYARLHTLLLPHDYLNYRLTGKRRMECGDASGTALLDVRRRVWCKAAIAAIDDELEEKLPSLMSNSEPCGTVTHELTSKWGLEGTVLVSSGGGDNMMSAIGAGNVAEGLVTVSLGTSGTIFAYASSPVVDPAGEVAAFCDSTGGWLPLVCTMNVTVATELIKSLFGMDAAGLEAHAGGVAPGCDGLLLIPYFEGERTPNIPNGTGVWFGANRVTHTRGHFARAAMEGVTMGINYGLQKLSALGISAQELRLTGGGSNSPTWRMIAADVFGLPVVCLGQSESAAFGAAIQARWCWERQKSSDVAVKQITEAWVTTAEETRALPDERRTAIYQELGSLQNHVSEALRPSFDLHREIVSKGLDS